MWVGSKASIGKTYFSVGISCIEVNGTSFPLQLRMGRVNKIDIINKTFTLCLFPNELCVMVI